MPSPLCPLQTHAALQTCVQVMSRAPTEASAWAVARHNPRAGLVTGGHQVRAPRFLAPHPLVQAAAQVGSHTVNAGRHACSD